MALFRRKSQEPANNPGPVPRHVAVIMDGNGRWAQSRGLPRVEGHRRGAKSVENVLNGCREAGVEYLTLYCFSNENWKRPKSELDFLMGLLKSYLTDQRASLIKNDCRLMIIGRRDGLPDDVLKVMDDAVAISSHCKTQTLCLAINYGARQELMDAMRRIAVEVAEGRLSPNHIDESTIEESLYTAGMPDPDLLIRTSGEMRISNYLLWQISYSEIWITDKLWPDFGKEDLFAALEVFRQRQRRFGGIG
jgi:undecaprenyl diphosphate synthase